MRNQHKDVFIYVLVFCLICYVVNYLLIVLGYIKTRHSVMLDAIVYVGLFVPYFWKYRRENILCFEFMAMPIGFIGLFFQDIILGYLPLITRYYYITDDAIKEKSATLQMIGWISFLLGSVKTYNKKTIKKHIITKVRVDYNRLIYLLTGVLLLLIIYDSYSGVFDTWFYYSNQDIIERSDRNQGLGHLTALILAASVVDIIRLRDLGVNSFKLFVLKCNKLLIAEWGFLSFLLLISGNRNEMLLILLPLVVSYTICIQKISNKILIIVFSVGIFLMVLSGSSRHEGVSIDNANFNTENFIIDYAVLGYDCDYMVKYTDQHQMTYMKVLPGSILSGIPVVGTWLIGLIDYPFPVSSSALCTESVGSNSGLGTSLIGDLYYNAGFLWVLIYMFLFGYFMSYLYKSDRNINIYLLMFYSYNVANAVYYVRSQWAFPLTIIEYSAIVVLIGSLFLRKQSI